jgi:glucose-1-phosphate cytidylyltransferase
MKYYSNYGYNNFIACLGYKGHRIREYFLNYEMMQCDVTVDLGRNNYFIHNTHSEENWKITLANTGEESMTGSRIKKIEKYVNSDLFMLTYGDGLSNVNIDELVKFHQQHGKIGTVTGVHPPSRFGELLMDGDKVAKFSEKPLTSEDRINGGFFVFNKDIFKYVTEDDHCTFEREPLEMLAADGELVVFKHDGFWQCMDTLRDLEYLEKLWLEPTCPWRKW